MKNITISLPDELAHKAKIFAAEHNTSVSKYVGQLLSEKLEAEQGYGKAMKAWVTGKRPVINESRGKYPDRDTLYDR